MKRSTERTGNASSPRKIPVFGVILAGGQGTRFWPLALESLPKQFLTLTGKRSLLQQTAARLRKTIPWSRILVVTTSKFSGNVREQLPRLPERNLLEEPCGRGTAACVALAARAVCDRVTDGVLVAAPADHHIRDHAGFSRTLATACSAAISNPSLVLMGASPTRAESGYGYIQTHQSLESLGNRAVPVRSFREKPSQAAARRLAVDGRHLWNCGILIGRSSVYLEAVRRLIPEISNVVSLEPSRLRARRYAKLSPVSFDVGILQPLSRMRSTKGLVMVVKAEFDWCDVGSWGGVDSLWPADEFHNTGVGKIVPIDSRNCVVFAPNHTIVALGLEGIVIVESNGAILVCPRERAQDVRLVPRGLRRRS